MAIIRSAVWRHDTYSDTCFSNSRWFSLSGPWLSSETAEEEADNYISVPSSQSWRFWRCLKWICNSEINVLVASPKNMEKNHIEAMWYDKLYPCSFRNIRKRNIVKSLLWHLVSMNEATFFYFCSPPKYHYFRKFFNILYIFSGRTSAASCILPWAMLWFWLAYTCEYRLLGESYPLNQGFSFIPKAFSF